jgi:hypothetical protein
MRSTLGVLLVILAALPVSAEPLPGDAGAIDVRSYGATGDGVHDDTAALLKAIAASGEDTGHTFWQDRPVYLPDGTYLVSDTLLKRYANGQFASGLFLIGQSRAHTVIKLADHAPGFDNPHQPRAVVFTTSKQVDGTPTSGGKDYPRLGEGNDAYMNFVEDLTIDVGHGNPGAIGIDYLANNIGAVRDVSLVAPADSGAIGLSMTRKWPGPALIQNLTVDGFDVGIATAQTEYGLTFDGIRLAGQRTGAMRNDQNALSIQNLNIEGPAPAIVNGGQKGFVAINGGKIRLTGSSPPIDNSGMVVARGLSVVRGPAQAELINGELAAGRDWKPVATPAWLPKSFEIPAPPALPPAQWASAAHYGATQDTAQPATDGLRRALGSGTATVYLPHGTYLIDDAVEIPASVRRIVGMNSTIRVATSRLPAFSRTAGMLKIASAGPSLSIENLAFDNTNQGAQLAVEISGSRDVVLRDIVSAGVVLLDRKKDGGRVLLENVCCGRMEIGGSQPVAARQFDTEGGGVRIVNRGSPLTILGLKTEGISTIVDNLDGARTDVFGGLVYMVRDPQGAALPAFHSTGSQLSASFAEEVLRAGNQYRVYLSDEPANAEAKSFPERGLGHFVPSLSAGPGTPPTQ